MHYAGSSFEDPRYYSCSNSLRRDGFRQCRALCAGVVPKTTNDDQIEIPRQATSIAPPRPDPPSAAHLTEKSESLAETTILLNKTAPSRQEPHPKVQHDVFPPLLIQAKGDGPTFVMIAVTRRFDEYLMEVP